MPTKKTAAPKPAPPYAKKLLTAWKNVAQKAVAGRSASLRDVRDQPGTREALAEAYDTGLFPAAALWRSGQDAADLAPARMAAAVLAARPAQDHSLFFAYVLVAALLARCLREDPTAFDAFAESASELDRALVDLARAEATAPADGAAPATRALLARQWTDTSAEFPALVALDGEVTRVRWPVEAHRAALDATLQRIFGPHLAADFAAAHRARLAEYDAFRGTHSYPLFPSPQALRLAASALTPEEVCGYQSQFTALRELSEAWSVDELRRAAAATAASGRVGSDLLTNSLAVLAVARDPAVAPQVEDHLSHADHTNQASPTAAYALEVLLRAPPAWRRRYAVATAFAPGVHGSVFGGPIALVLLASVDPAAAELVAAERADELDTTRLNGFDPTVLASLLDTTRPALTRALALPTFVGYVHLATDPPAALDAYFAFEGTNRDSWLVGYLFALSTESALAIVGREFAAGRAEWARAALAGHPTGAALLANAQ